MQTPDGNGRLELTTFHSPSNPGDNRHAPANRPGIGQVAFAAEDIDVVVAGLRARGAELVGDVEHRAQALSQPSHRRPFGLSAPYRGSRFEAAPPRVPASSVVGASAVHVVVARVVKRTHKSVQECPDL